MGGEGKISVACIDGKWWFLAPDGTPFISLGINHVDPLFLTGPYNRHRTEAIYGDDLLSPEGKFNFRGNAMVRWLSQVKKDFRDWGFNALGYYTEVPVPLPESGLHYIRRIRVIKTNFYEKFPDVFDEAFARSVDDKVKAASLECRDDPALLGYAFSDISTFEKSMRKSIRIPDKFEKKSSKLFAALLKKEIEKERERCDPIHPCVSRYFSFPFGAPGKRQWVEVLRTNYATPEEASLIYGIHASSWDDFEQATEWPEPTNKLSARKDNLAMLTRISQQYYSLIHTAVRKYDSTHLIFGDKLNGNNEVPEYLLPILKKYVDVIMIDWDELFHRQCERFNHIYQATGKPILLSDSSFAIIKEKQIYSKGYLLDTPDELGSAYIDYLKKAMKTPYIIGWHYCGYVEGWEGLDTSRDPLSNMQCGLKDPFENVDPNMMRDVAYANRLAVKWHMDGRERRANEHNG